MSLKTYKNMFIKNLISDETKELEQFNLTDQFYKEFTNRNSKFMLFMLRPARDVINGFIDLVSQYKNNLLSANCIGFSDYDTIILSFVFDCEINLKKTKGFGEANINWFDIKNINDKTTLTIKIYIAPRNKPFV